MKNWLDKYNTPEAQNGIEGTMGGLTDIPFKYNGAWGGPSMQMGGSLPGAVGFSYARTQGAAPSNGPYAKKTKASAQNGEEMKFYQEGLDWKPKTISRDGTILDKFQDGGEKTYGTYQLPEVVVTPEPEEKGFWQQSIRSYLDENKDAGFLGALGSVVTYPLGLPQQAMMYGLTGKVQRPSTGMGITNPYGALATDIIADPTNLLGVGIADDALKVSSKVGKFLTEKTALKNAYKLFPENTFKGYSKLNNPNSSYRVAGFDAAEDFVSTGGLRSNPTIVPTDFKNGVLPTRTTAFPSFQKGYADISYLPQEGGVVFKTDLPTYKRGELNPVTGNAIKGRHYAHRVIDPETGNTVTNIPGENISMFEGSSDWLKGYKEIPKTKQNFQSEINWGNWNKEIPENPQLMKEYNVIEQTSKANNTWMKNPDGSTFQGTPEQFVQQNSENFKKAFPKGSNISYRGDLSKISELKSQQELGKEAIKRKYNLNNDDTEALEELWKRAKDKLNSGKYTTNDYEAALKYARGDKDKVLSLYTDIRNPKFTEPGESFRVLEKDRQKLLSERYDALITNPSSFYPEGENVLLRNNQIKSAIGNSGMFDMTNPNIYKGLVPATMVGGLAAGSSKKENGGWLSKFEDGGKKSSKALAPEIKYMEEYLSSPMYLERLAKMAGTEKQLQPTNQGKFYSEQFEQSNIDDSLSAVANKQATRSKEALKDIAGNISIGDYNLGTNVAGVYDSGLKDIRLRQDLFNQNPTVGIHELSHATLSGREPYTQRFQEKYLNPIFKEPGSVGWEPYVQKPGEIKARLDSVRFLAQKKGLYNPGKEKFTEKHLQMLEKDPEIKKDFNYQQLKDQLKEGTKKTGFIWMMNNIAKLQDQPSTTDSLVARDGKVITDPRGQWAHPGEITRIPSNEITMQGVDYPVLGISDTGDTQMMQPGQDYTYEGESVTEYPMMKEGGSTASTITCPNCGWTWKKSEAGNDPYVCHKCGMNNASKIQNSKKENGGWLNKYN